MGGGERGALCTVENMELGLGKGLLLHSLAKHEAFVCYDWVMEMNVNIRLRSQRNKTKSLNVNHSHIDVGACE